jgi:integrase
MHRRLTDRSVRSLRPKRGDRIARFLDTVVPGLVLQVTATDVRSFYFVYRVATKKHARWKRIGDPADLSLADARDIARRHRAGVANGKDPIEEQRKAEAAALDAQRKADAEKTFATLAQAFVDDLRAAHKRSWRNYHRVLIGGVLPDATRTLTRKKASPHKPLSELWADRKIKDISRRDVRDVIEAIKRRKKFVHANRTFAYIRQAFNFALDREWIDANPCAGIHKRIRSEERPRSRVLSDEEIRRLWNGLDDESPVIADVVRVLILTWQRSGEVFRMRRDELHADGWWELPESRTKNGLRHRVYLTKPVRDILDRRLIEQRRTQYADCEWVFRSPKRPDRPIAHITKAILRLRAQTGIEFRPHDLRRTAASLAAKAGVPELTIPKVLGHLPTGVTRTHYNLFAYDGEKQAALELWAREIDRILRDEQPETGIVVSFFGRA